MLSNLQEFLGYVKSYGVVDFITTWLLFSFLVMSSIILFEPAHFLTLTFGLGLLFTISAYIYMFKKDN